MRAERAFWIIILGACVGFVVTAHLRSSSSSAWADNGYWTPERRSACPADYRAPVELGGTIFYVNFRMLTDLELIDYPIPLETCPSTAPLKARSIYFYYGYEELAMLYKQLALPLTRLKIEVGTRKSIWRWPFPGFTDKRRAIGADGFIEDVSDRALFDTQPLLGRRAYLLQHSGGFGTKPILMICSGDPGGSPPRRDCEADYVLEQDLIVRYSFRQDGRDQPAKRWGIPPDGEIQEPEGLLEIDRKVRNLIAYLQSQT